MSFREAFCSCCVSCDKAYLVQIKVVVLEVPERSVAREMIICAIQPHTDVSVWSGQRVVYSTARQIQGRDSCLEQVYQ